MTRFTLWSRSVATFDAYLNGQLRPLFYGAEFRDALAQRVQDTDKRMKAALTACLFLLALIVFSEALTRVSFGFGVIQITDVRPFQDAIVFLLASASVGLSFVILDYLLLERCLHKIYFSAGLFSPRLLYMHIAPQGLWSDMLALRYFGPRSTWQHKALAFLVGSLILLPLTILLLTPPLTAAIYSMPMICEPKPLAIRALGVAALIMSVGAIATPFVALFVPVAFSDADFDETTSEPTKEFLERLAQDDQTGDPTAV